MNRLLRCIFFSFAALLTAYAVSVGYYLHVVEEPVLGAKVVGLALALAFFFAVAGWRFSLKLKFKIFAVCLSLLLVELLLQAAAWLGVLPGVNILYTNAKAPFARVYWTTEGRGNGIRNRYGWYCPPFDLKASHRIVYLGDSQIESLQIPCARNQTSDLQNLLKRKSPDWSVLGLGISATCPAYSIDLLDFAYRHFQPQEAIVTVSMALAVTEASPILCRHPVDRYIYYDLGSSGGLVLNPASATAREHFDRELETSQLLLVNLPLIIDSHCMILQAVDSVLDHLATNRRKDELVAHGMRPNGFNPATFAVPPSPEAQRALKILIAQLQQCKKVCDSHGIKFRLVTIPVFPKAFYDSQHGRDWTMHIGDYDYFGPEREVTAWARTNGIPIVSMGEYIQRKKLDVEEIRSLCFSDGTGHLTVKGHEFYAQAVYETFYENSSF
jgi:hypothetical protein